MNALGLRVVGHAEWRVGMRRLVRVVSVIPARGGSKGIPGKNLAIVGQWSLVERAVRCARMSRAIDLCIVSSDDPEILREADRCGAVALERPPHLALDSTTTDEAIQHLLGDPLLFDAEQLIVLQPTSPFRSPGDIDRCSDHLAHGVSAVTVCEVEHPVEWTFRRTSDGLLDVPSARIPVRRQGTESRFRLAGSVYASRVAHLRAGHGLVNSSSFGVVVPSSRALDIDEPIDLEIARALAETSFDPLASPFSSRAPRRAR